jgi:hypothetical protein
MILHSVLDLAPIIQGSDAAQAFRKTGRAPGREQLTACALRSGATAQVFDDAARLRSFEIAAGLFDEINAARATAPLAH